jgi:hypothetical protein
MNRYISVFDPVNGDAQLATVVTNENNNNGSNNKHKQINNPPGRSIPIPKLKLNQKLSNKPSITVNVKRQRNNHEAGLIRRGMSPQNAKKQTNAIYGSLSNIESSYDSLEHPYYERLKWRRNNRKTRKQRRKTN